MSALLSAKHFEKTQIRPQAFIYFGRLRKLDFFVQQHISEPLSVAQAASIVNLQPTYFSAWFQKRVGVGFRHWVNYVRVIKAQEILRDCNHSVTEVGLEVGFGSLRTLERNFLRFTGISAADFKSQTGLNSDQSQ